MKNRSIIIFSAFVIVCIVCIVWTMAFYLLREKSGLQNNSGISQIQVLQSKTTTLVKTELVSPSTVQDEKVMRALRYVEKNSRKPSTTLKSSPQHLLSQDSVLLPRWQIWSTAKAFLPDQTTAADNVVARLSRYNIVETGTHFASLSDFQRTSPVVVFDQRLKKPGIVTGLIKIGCDQKSLLETFLIHVDAEIIQSFEDIRLYYVTSKQNAFNLEVLYATLKKQQFVTSIELDILDRGYEKN